MSCYFRHLQDIFNEAGVEVTKENKKDIDRKIHDLVGVDYKDCSNTWKEIKKRLAENEEGFVADIGARLSEFR